MSGTKSKSDMKIIKCLVEVRGYPDYMDECLFYIQNERQEIIAGPYNSKAQAEMFACFPESIR